MSAADFAALLGAGVLAGIVGTAGGITSLISYPALLAVGIAALPANIVNSLALVACLPGAASASRPELRGRGSWLRRWTVVTAAGGAVGSALLLTTPAGVFGRIVPFLVAAASVALLLQPRLSRGHEEGVAWGGRLLLPLGLFSVAVYNGYFGAGAGVMILTLLLLAVDQHIATANALKNMLVGVAAVVSAVIFVLLGHVEWSPVLPLALGLFAGSMIGPRIARRLPGNILRWLVALVGLGLAVRLWFLPA